MAALAASQDPGTALAGIGHVPVHLGRDALVVERAEVGRLDERVAEHYLSGGPQYGLHEGVVDVAVYHDPLCGAAHLARAQGGAVHRRLCRGVQVGVAEHH